MKTLAAVMTGSGTSAIATLEVLGPDAYNILSLIFTPSGPKPLNSNVGSIRVGTLHDNHHPIDQMTLGCEGQHHWALHCHGNPLIVERAMALLKAQGIRLVSPKTIQARQLAATSLLPCQQEAKLALGRCKSLLGAFVVVFVMMAVLFRSVRFGLLAMLPLTATILSVYGLIGWIGKSYDMPVAVLSSLTLGLSVDFAIHFIQRMRSLYAQTGSFAQAAQRMFEAPARAITRNAIVIALGFTPLLLAPLVPYVTVGIFMASIMAISGLATLVLLPSVMSVLGGILFDDSAKGVQE